MAALRAAHPWRVWHLFSAYLCAPATPALKALLGVLRGHANQIH